MAPNGRCTCETESESITDDERSNRTAKSLTERWFTGTGATPMRNIGRVGRMGRGSGSMSSKAGSVRLHNDKIHATVHSAAFRS